MKDTLNIAQQLIADAHERKLKAIAERREPEPTSTDASQQHALQLIAEAQARAGKATQK
jgi:hypothetical protein